MMLVTIFRNFNLASGFFEAALRHPDRIALSSAESDVTYGALLDSAARLGAFVKPRLRSRRVGVLATRSVEAYVGILGACLAGATYVPLSLKWPEERLVTLLHLLDLDALVADRNGAALLSERVLQAAPELVIVADDAAPLPAAGRRRPVRISEISAAPLEAPEPVGAEDVGYVIFTSGSTGLPKGVMIAAASLDAYLAETRAWTAYGPEDRVAETCDVTFDLSVHNLFLALESGASLHLMSQLEMLAPARFVRTRQITCWMSVPTLINLMRQNGSLRPEIFPSLRLSIFCGEPLPLASAQAWAQAAPNGVVENIYGPTECTVVCLRQTLIEPPAVTPGRGILAIGSPYGTMEVAIFDQDQQPVADGAVGEIALSGPQVGVGYFASPEQTSDRFREIRGRRWYLTGDLGLRDDEGVFHHLGRTDNQVKVMGNRIELEEVEAHLRDAAGTELVAVVAWPKIGESYQGLVGFVSGSDLPVEEIRQKLLRTLPRSMIPERIDRLPTLPVNINGKVDRGALKVWLEDERRVLRAG